MTTRLNLLFHNLDPNAFSHEHMKSFLERYFNILIYQPDTTYNPQDTILAVNSFKIQKPDADYWYVPFQQQGFKIVVDNLWEYKTFYQEHFPADHVPGCYMATNSNWFWYSESLWYQHLGYHNYTPNKQYTKLALMPMRVDRQHRREIVRSLSSMLDSIIWSYSSRGRSLPDDIDTAHIDYQRYFNPTWYNSTYFSIVTESLVEGPDLFVTEKTFKPMAFYHPMIVMGQQGVLQYVKSQGFETFENLFDESYDTEPEAARRIEMIKKNIQDFDPVAYTQLTKQKLQHNHALFFNTSLIEQRMYTEVIVPILEYASC